MCGDFRACLDEALISTRILPLSGEDAVLNALCAVESTSANNRGNMSGISEQRQTSFVSRMHRNVFPLATGMRGAVKWKVNFKAVVEPHA